MNVTLLAAAGGLVMLLATPVLAMTVLLVAMERFMGVGIFDPARRGDPILFQHMFWFYSHRRLHHDSAGNGRRQRAHHLLRAQADLRLHRDDLCAYGNRDHQLLCLGSSYVHGGNLDLFRRGVKRTPFVRQPEPRLKV
jgi:hypothetical protein